MRALPVTELADFVAQHPDTVLLDVREPWELAVAAIQLPDVSTLAIPMAQIPEQLERLPRDAELVCICHHGMRSAHVARYLMQAGFSNIWNLTGGTDAWSLAVDARVPRY